MKKYLLQLIAIKLSAKKHKAFCQVLTKLAYIAWLVLFVILIANRIVFWVSADDLLERGVKVDTVATLETRGSGKKTRYVYQYIFETESHIVKGEYFANRKNARRWGEQTEVTIVYLPDDLTRHKPEQILLNRTSVKEFFWGIFNFLWAGSLAVWLTYTFIIAVLVIPRKSSLDETSSTGASSKDVFSTQTKD